MNAAFCNMAMVPFGSVTACFSAGKQENRVDCQLAGVADRQGTRSIRLGFSRFQLLSFLVALLLPIFTIAAETENNPSFCFDGNESSCYNGLNEKSPSFTPFMDATFTCTGSAVLVTREVNITNAFFALGPQDDNFAQLYETNDTLTLKLEEEVVSGSIVVIRWKKTGSTNPTVTVAQSGNNTTWTTPTSYTVSLTAFTTQSITLSTDTRYLRFRNTNGADLQLDAVTFTSQTCNYTDGGGLPLTCAATSTSIAGTAFHDVNGNGSYDSGNDYLGIAGITVNAIDSLGTAFSTTTGSTGTYSFTGLVANRTYRVEFHLPTSLSWMNSSFRGGNNGTTVQFIKPGNCANLGLTSPTDYCQSQPDLVLPCYENGSGVGNTNPAVVSMPYSSSGISPAESMDIQTQSVGAVYGAAYDRRNKRVYVSSFLKRHSGFGPRGVDGVYVLDYSTSTPSVIGGFDLQGVVPANGGAAIDLGTINRTHITTAISSGAAGDYQLPSSRTNPSVDLDAFGKVGTISYGDIDMSEDGRTLWMVNLNQKALIAVDIMNLSMSTTNPYSPPSSIVRQYLLSSMTGLPVCSNGTLRPFGLEFYKGKGYVGCVCDANTSSTLKKPSELDGYVLSFDPSNPTALTTVLNFGFDHNREASYSQLNPASGVVAGEWQRWINAYNTSLVNTGFVSFQSAPQPIISDIEITDEGDIILGVMDRYPHQQGWDQYQAISADRTNVSGISTGDILKFGLSSGTYVPELGENDTKNSPAGFITNDGIGSGGEFFNGDFYTGWDASHCETGLGGITLKPGSTEIVSGTLDPLAFNSQGITWFNMGTGAQNKMYQVVGSTNIANFGKGSALGDFELMCDAAPIEIGNYVWIDTDKDGVQDPGEQGLNGVKVGLYKLVSGTATLVASTTTATVNGLTGAYYFRDYQQYGTGFDTLVFNTQYYIVLGESGGTYTWSTANQNLAVGGSNYVLTTANTGTGTTPDQNDSDAFVFTTTGKPYTNYPVDTITIGNAGYVNHTLDFGLKPCPTITNPSATQTICAGGTGSNITVNTNRNTANSIRFVRFTSDQMAGSTPTTAEAAAIYSGTVIATVTPTGSSSPYTATYVFNAADFPSSSNTYYVYAILNPDEGAACRPTQEIRININNVTASTVSGDQTVCQSGDPAVFTVATAATGAGTLTYQWQKSTTGCSADFSNISSATSATYNPPSGLTQTTYYRVIVTSTLNSVACTATSNCITVTVLPFCETYCPNNIISNASFESPALPGSGTFSFAGGTAVNLATAAPTGYSKATTSGDNYWVQSSKARTGNKYIYMYSSGTTPASSDACTQFTKSSITGNTTYNICIFAADAKADGLGSGMSLEVQEVGGPFHWLNFLLPNNTAWSDASATNIPWQQYCYTFTTAPTTTSLTMWLSASAEQGGATAYIVVDDVCVEATSSPQLPTIGGSTSTAATCTGGTANDNAGITLTGIVNGTKADKVLGATYTSGPAFGASSNVNVSGGNAIFTGLSPNTQYTFRVWNAKCDCYQDITLTTPLTCCVAAGTVGTDQTVCNGGDPAAFAVSSAATGNGTLSYQWQSSTTNCSAGFSNISGATSSAYDPPSGLSQTTYYRVIVTNTIGASTCTATSNCVTVTVNSVTGGTVGSDQTICSGGDPTAFTQSVASTGSGTLTYQWQSSTTSCAAGFSNISGATSTTYDAPSGLAQTTYYRRVTTSTLNSVACTATSNCVTVTVNSVTGGTVGSDQTICSGGDPAAFTQSVASTGSGSLTYQWQSGTTNCSTGFTNISGATSATYDAPSGLTQTTYYRRVTTSTFNSVACTATSNCVTVTVNNVTASTVGSNQTICSGGDPAAFTVSTPATGSGTLSYQWQASTANCSTGFSNISGATSATYDAPSGLAQTTYYRVIVTSTLNTLTCTATSNCVTVTVNNVTASTVGSDQTICSGGDPAAFTISAPATGSGILSYQWQRSTTNCSSGFTNISGATSATYDAPSGLAQTTYYRVIAISTLNAVGCSAASNCLTVTVGSFPDFTLGLASVCPGDNPQVTIGGLTGGTAAVSTMKINTGVYVPYVASPPNLTTFDGIVPNTTNTITVRNEYGCETPKNIAVPAIVPLVCPPVSVTKSPAGSD